MNYADAGDLIELIESRESYLMGEIRHRRPLVTR